MRGIFTGDNLDKVGLALCMVILVCIAVAAIFSTYAYVRFLLS